MNYQVLTISALDGVRDNGGFQAEFRMKRRRHRVYFRSSDTDLAPSNEAFLTLTLLPAMREGLAVRVDGRVSGGLLAAAPRIMKTFRRWDPSLHEIEIISEGPMEERPRMGERIGTFFTGGMDSFYTLLKHRDEITDLIYVHGFDVKLDDFPQRQRASQIVRKVGAGFGKNVIEIETNLRSFLRPYVSYATLSHGAALAGIGHLLAPFFRRMYIASTYTRDHLFPWGSHPELDPLWSTETLEFVHDGGEATRVEKAAWLSESDLALQSLRVCAGGTNNCGRCEKCVRTMINLASVGALDRCTSFDVPLNLRNVRKILVHDEHTRAFVDENLQALENGACDPQLYDALREVADRSAWRTNAMLSMRRLRQSVLRRHRKFKRRMESLLPEPGQ